MCMESVSLLYLVLFVAAPVFICVIRFACVYVRFVCQIDVTSSGYLKWEVRLCAYCRKCGSARLLCMLIVFYISALKYASLNQVKRIFPLLVF